MRSIFLLILLIVFASCNYFERKKVNSDDLVKEQLKTFNWRDVDTYPTFSKCDSIIDKAESKICFQNTIVSHVQNDLKLQEFIVSKDIKDTIKLKLKVNNQGITSVETISIKPETISEIPQIDTLLRQSIATLPKLYPAIKRGQQVSTEFTLPIVINIQ